MQTKPFLLRERTPRHDTDPIQAPDLQKATPKTTATSAPTTPTLTQEDTERNREQVGARNATTANAQTDYPDAHNITKLTDIHRTLGTTQRPPMAEATTPLQTPVTTVLKTPTLPKFS